MEKNEVVQNEKTKARKERVELLSTAVAATGGVITIAATIVGLANNIKANNKRKLLARVANDTATVKDYKKLEKMALKGEVECDLEKLHQKIEYLTSQKQ